MKKDPYRMKKENSRPIKFRIIVKNVNNRESKLHLKRKVNFKLRLKKIILNFKKLNSI